MPAVSFRFAVINSQFTVINLQFFLINLQFTVINSQFMRVNSVEISDFRFHVSVAPQNFSAMRVEKSYELFKKVREQLYETSGTIA